MHVAARTMILLHLLSLALLHWGCASPSTPASTSPPDSANHAPAPTRGTQSARVVTGAEQLIATRLDILKGRRVAIVANHTSLVADSVHLVDTLKALGVNIRKVFAPEHGFRGDHDAGKHVANGKDARTGLPLISLYGSNKKPTAAQLADVDLVLFDIQDVGTRFYTYISTMSLVMEACAEQKKTFVVLDRPNPNGWYVEGPVMEAGYESFVGMHRVPIVHGLTVGEYAQMVNQEGWLKGGVKCLLEVIQCQGYAHGMRWEQTGLPWVPPSPNLSTEYSAYLYPMLCWFEGMAVSVGRGTEHPFEILGAPWHLGYQHAIRRDSFDQVESPSRFQYYGLEAEYIRFTPRSIPGKSANPDYKDKECYGAWFKNRVEGKELFLAGLALAKNLEKESREVKLAEPLFRESFPLLLGSNKIEKAIRAQTPEAQIYDSWQPALSNFKVMRKRYLLYPD